MRSELKELLLSFSARFSVALNEKALSQFERYLKLIQEYNQKFNLSGIEDEEGIVVKHFLDSLAGNLFLKEHWFLADLGSGMGCPGIPLKIVKPSLKLILLEPHQKKCAFLNLVIRELGLENTRGLRQRAEDKKFQMSMQGQLDAILARGLGKLDLILKLAMPYLKSGGRILAYKGPQVDAELKKAQGLMEKFPFQNEQIYDYEVPLGRGKRKLVIIRKS